MSGPDLRRLWSGPIAGWASGRNGRGIGAYNSTGARLAEGTAQRTHTREEIVRLTALLQKVCSVHGKNHPELFEIQATFAGVAQELTTHMMKEDRCSFPIS